VNPDTTSSNVNDRDGIVDPEVIAKLSRLQVRARGLVEGSFSGMHRSPHRGSSVEFSQYRKYVHGDDIKNVDWNVYAKTDRFYIKEFEADTNLRCHLLLDCSASMGYAGNHGISKFKYARKMIAVLAQLLVQQGDAVGLQCFNEAITHDIPARNNPRHLRNIFDTLQGMSPGGGTEVVKELHNLAEKIHRRALIIVFSDFFTDIDELLDCFQHMRYRKHDLAVFHLLHKDELDFNFDRSIRFLDLESSFAMVAEPELIRQDYQRELRDYLKRMRQGCDEFKVDYRFTEISTPYDKILTEFLLSRQKV
jgi:uncharacterized protein (DUF58 family)